MELVVFVWYENITPNQHEMRIQALDSCLGEARFERTKKKQIPARKGKIEQGGVREIEREGGWGEREGKRGIENRLRQERGKTKRKRNRKRSE